MEGDTSEDSEDQLEEKTKKRKIKQKGTQEVKKRKSIQQSNQEISDEDYRQLLLDISEWYDEIGSISMLKVLYTDLVTDVHTIDNATKMRDLLDNLHGSGNLSPTDLSVLYDTINITEQFGFKPRNENLLPLFQNVRNFEISKFTLHRQKLVKLGMKLTREDVARLDGYFNTRQRKYEDNWHLIKDLEHRTEICEGKIEAFINKLSELQRSAIGALTGDIERGSSNSEQTSGEGIPVTSSSLPELCDKDSVIRKYLLSSQRRVCCSANLFTPATWNPRFQVDIAHMFTDLDLLKESKNQVNKDGKATTLENVLDIIKSTPACKALIEGEGGIGKSTLLRYVAYKWAKEESYETFKGKIVFLVNIRDIGIGETVLDAILEQVDLEDFYLETDLPQNPVLIKRFIRNHNKDIVLLLDGLDELKVCSVSPLSIFKNQQMCECKVILTSRSENINEFIKASSIHVKVKGFSTDCIQKYIKVHFAFFEEPALGDSLIKELLTKKHMEVYSICKNPMLLLTVCIMWEEDQHIPADKADLFKEIFRSILNQFIDKQEIKQKISKFEDTPEKFVNAMILLGMCFYKSLKRNQLSINKSEIKGKKECIDLALNLGFVYQDTPNRKSKFDDVFTTSHKLIVESLVGFYLYKLCQREGLKHVGSKGLDKLITPLTENEWQMIRRSEYFHMARVFTIGFLGADAGTFLSHWITNNVSTYRSLMEYLRCVKQENLDTVEKAVISHMARTDLEVKPHINDICKSLRKFIHCIIPDVKASQNEHFIKLMRTFDNLKLLSKQVCCICREMPSEERGRMLAHILIAVSNQLQTYFFEKIICRICDDDDISYLTTECQKLYFKYDITHCTLPDLSTNSFVVHLLSNAPQLTHLYSFGNKTVSMNDVIKECFSKCVMLELTELCISDINLSNIDGSQFASLFITPQLKILDMSNCSLSGVTMNDMIRECSGKGVQLELWKLKISGNNLSHINLSSFASIFITPKQNILDISNCSLPGVVISSMIREFFERRVKWELVEFYISGNNLSNIDGSAFASLFIAPQLKMLDMGNCSLSGVIMNDMIRECSSSGVRLELEMLIISGNNLSNIDGSLFASFITPKLCFLDMSDCSLSGVIMNDMIRECSGSEVKLKLEDLTISGNNLKNMDVSSFASLFINPKLDLLEMSDCSLSDFMKTKIRECCGIGVKLEFGDT